MIRNESWEDLSDGKRYHKNDIVAADCGGCVGCHKCCEDTGDTIVLDPYDLWRLSNGLSKSFEELLERGVALGIYDGIVLPYLAKTEKNGMERCYFLGTIGDEAGRCLIHPYRPGFCRMFPLGRMYEGENFSYILQVHECPYPEKKPAKVEALLDQPDLEQYEDYIQKWHSLIKRIRERMPMLDHEEQRMLSTVIIQYFYRAPYKNEDFYSEFERRLDRILTLF